MQFITVLCVVLLVIGFLPIAVFYMKKWIGTLLVCKESNIVFYLQIIYLPLCGKLPPYLSSLLSFSDTNYQARSQTHIRLIIPRIISEAGKSASTFYAPDKLNKLQDSLYRDQTVQFETFRILLQDESHGLLFLLLVFFSACTYDFLLSIIIYVLYYLICMLCKWAFFQLLSLVK